MSTLKNPNFGEVKPWLVTGGAGYIGGHVLSVLKESGIPSISLDIDQESFQRKFPLQIANENCDIRDMDALKKVFNNYSFEGIIHLAALKSVEESQLNPKAYFETNVLGTKNILDLMDKHNIKKIIFSSSAAVYESPQSDFFVDESSALKPISNYGVTKLDSEKLINEYTELYELQPVIFRYFNVAGSANLNLKDTSTQNLIPITIKKILSGIQPEIFGDNYETPDGTAIRDYVDVRDIANAHLKAIDYLSHNPKGCVLNIGTGKGASVKEVVLKVQEIMGSNIPYIIKDRRIGDISAITANCSKAKSVIGFESKFNLQQMIETSI